MAELLTEGFQRHRNLAFLTPLGPLPGASSAQVSSVAAVIAGAGSL
jgi:hypothetical protein